MAADEQSRSLINPLADCLGYQLRRVSLSYLGALTEVMGSLDLKVTEATFLMFVAANPGCSQGDISRTLEVKRTNMVPTVNALVKRNLVARQAVDGRTNALTLTESGATLHVALLETVQRCEHSFFGYLAPEMTKGLSQTLGTIRRHAEGKSRPVDLLPEPPGLEE